MATVKGSGLHILVLIVMVGAKAQWGKVKARLALRLRRETTLAVTWIAARLRVGSRGAASKLLNRK